MYYLIVIHVVDIELLISYLPRYDAVAMYCIYNIKFMFNLLLFVDTIFQQHFMCRVLLRKRISKFNNKTFDKDAVFLTFPDDNEL